MAFSHIQHTTATNADPVLTVTSGNLLIVGASWYQDTHGLTNLSDGTNSWVHASGALVQNTDWNTDVWYVLSCASGSTTVTPTWSGGTPLGFALHFYEFNPGGVVSFDTASTNTDITGTVTGTSINLATALAGELLFSIVNQSGSATPTIPTGWDGADLHTGSAYFDDSSYRLNAGAAGAGKTADWDFGSFGAYTESFVAFKVPAAAADTLEWRGTYPVVFPKTVSMIGY